MNKRYEITRLISKDHAGGIYEGEDTVLNRKVACRRFFDVEGDASVDKWADDFHSFTHKLTALQHPNIVTVFDAGIDEDGAFLISQLVEGETIHDCIAQSPLEAHRVYQMANDVLDAFSAIHEIGETHGALVPKSITRLPRAGGKYRYMITDLGLAALMPIIQGVPLDTKNPALTAPEILQGESPTPQSDLFMLGQLCYTAVAGGHPFGDASRETALQHHLSGDQPSLLELEHSTPPELVKWIETLIKADPSERPASAAEALGALPRVMAPVQHTTSHVREQAPAHVTPKTSTQSPKLTTGAAIPAATQPAATAGSLTSGAAQAAANKPNDITSLVGTRPPGNATSAHPTLTGLASSQKSSNTGLIVGLSVAAVAIVAGAIVLMGPKSKDKPGENSTANNGTLNADDTPTPDSSKPKTPEPPSTPPTLSIGSVTMVNTISNRSKPKVVEFMKQTTVDWIVPLRPPAKRYAASVSPPPIIRGVTQYPKGSFKSRQLKAQPVHFTTNFGPKGKVKTHAPGVGGNTMKAGAGWQIELLTPRKHTGTLKTYLYALQWNTEIKVELVSETNEVISAETIPVKHSPGIIRIPLDLKSLKAYTIYYIRVTCVKPDKKKGYSLGLSAFQIAKD